MVKLRHKITTPEKPRQRGRRLAAAKLSRRKSGTAASVSVRAAASARGRPSK